ncbi:B3 domain-containing protein [Morus notabilis]|uniref:B3 domain-containing protein n=1 Tax=Morus notabilis TaxID=981085 RepID=W9RFQ0_9ROSA|nr:B3 domain-containing protein Os04g0386900 [Morus notabilis]EXB70636.1 B3 domain-containing protein [Morus notabilis]
MEQDSHSAFNTSPVSNTEHDLESEEFWTLSGKKPFFDIILTKSHINPRYLLTLPAKIQPVLPSLATPAVLTYGGKEWNLTYRGSNASCKKLDGSWQNFVDDNNLKIGDACVFELDESSCKKLVFRVQILRGDIPPELHSKIVGESSDSPIVIE